MINRKTIGVSIVNGPRERYSTYDDFQLIMVNKNISSPEPQLKYVEVPGRNGSVDMSEVATGDVRYKNRKIELTFFTQKKVNEWDVFLSDLRNKLCGRKMCYLFDDDNMFYWNGRCEEISFSNKGMLGYITLKITVEPFKYSIWLTPDDMLLNPVDISEAYRYTNIEVDGLEQIALVGKKRLTSPVIICDSDNMKVKYLNKEYNLIKGEQTVNIKLTEGSDVLSFIGYGRVTVNVCGGSL